MKKNAINMLLLLLAVSSQARAEPFWCPPGEDRVPDHSLYYESLKDRLDSEVSELAKIIVVEDALITHTRRLTPDGSTNGEVKRFSAAIRGIFDASKEATFRNTSVFDLDRLETLGIPRESCESAAVELLDKHPALYATYAAIETIYLIGRASSLEGSNAAFIEKQYQAYDAWLLTNGLPQWPWELWLNGKRVSSDIREAPPSTQLIFLRPSAGIALSYPSQEGADAVPTFAAELIGFVRYREESDYKKHIGASILTTIGTEDGAGLGIGLRWNSFMLGYVARSGDAGDSLFLSVDLYKILNSEEKRSDFSQEFAEEFFPALKGASN